MPVTRVTGTRTNLVTNPSFEVDIVSWTNDSFVAPTTLARETGAWSRKLGDGFLRFTISDANATPRTVSVGTPTGASGMPVVVGTTYTLSARVAVQDATAAGVWVRLEWYNGAAFLGGTDSAVQNGTGEKDLAVTAVAPGTATHARVAIKSTSGSSDIFDIYGDAALLEAASAASTYFDGSGYITNGGAWVTGRTAWTGAAHASASTLRAGNYPRRHGSRGTTL